MFLYWREYENSGEEPESIGLNHVAASVAGNIAAAQDAAIARPGRRATIGVDLHPEHGRTRYSVQYHPGPVKRTSYEDDGMTSDALAAQIDGLAQELRGQPKFLYVAFDYLSVEDESPCFYAAWDAAPVYKQRLGATVEGARATIARGRQQRNQEW